jgi:hypothetical protein
MSMKTVDPPSALEYKLQVCVIPQTCAVTFAPTVPTPYALKFDLASIGARTRSGDVIVSGPITTRAVRIASTIAVSGNAVVEMVAIIGRAEGISAWLARH